MNARIVGWSVAAVGLILFVVSLTADLTGLGDHEGFQIGVKQGAGIASGLVLIVVGLAILKRINKSGECRYVRPLRATQACTEWVSRCRFGLGPTEQNPLVQATGLGVSAHYRRGVHHGGVRPQR